MKLAYFFAKPAAYLSDPYVLPFFSCLSFSGLESLFEIKVAKLLALMYLSGS